MTYWGQRGPTGANGGLSRLKRMYGGFWGPARTFVCLYGFLGAYGDRWGLMGSMGAYGGL